MDSRGIRALVALIGVAALGVYAHRSADSDGQVQLRLESDEQSLGRADAPVTIVEFTDYQCPFCRKFEAEVLPRLKREFIDRGQLRFIVRDLPLEFHANAQPAAEAAHCAAEQGAFWPMHDALLAQKADLTPHSIEEDAQHLHLDLTRFQLCVRGTRYADAIQRNVAQAKALNLDGTPAFVIGRTRGGVLTGWAVMGARPYEDFAAALREMLHPS